MESELPRAADAWLAVVIFSKDRPCQLLCSLVSLLRHVRGVALDISVLYKASQPTFAESYFVVESLFQRRLYPSFAPVEWHWMEETDETSLGKLLDSMLARVREKTATVLLTVDDALWFNDFNAAAAMQLLKSDNRIYSVHAKLCPRIEYAHPNDKFMRVPPFSLHESTDSKEEGEKISPDLLIFEREKGEYDWNYPWELSASLYRLESVEEVIQAIRSEFGSGAVDHPNHLEGYGVRLLKQQKLPSAKSSKYCACVTDPVLKVVTVNRVQSLFDNPVYSQSDGSEISVDELDQVLRYALLQAGLADGDAADAAAAADALAQKLPGSDGWWKSYLKGVETLELQPWTRNFDLSRQWPPNLLNRVAMMYSTTYLDSVHVPLPCTMVNMVAMVAMVPSPDFQHPIVSWLMPVKDTPSKWLDLALDSIERQEGMVPGSWELIVVDDGSSQVETKETLAAWSKRPFIQVIEGLATSGIAAALNEGWKRCRGKYVARLDGDDCAHPQRLKKQIGFLENHPSIAVLGGGFCTFEDGDPRSLPASSLKRYRMPCHPILTRWRMMFSCSLAHPSVIFRRSAFDNGNSGPYPEGREAEDHWCWLSLALERPIANLADVLSFLRRHRGSRSSQAAEALQKSSFQAVQSFLRSFQLELKEEDVKVLWGKANADSAEQVDRVSKALDTLEAAFLNMVRTGTTPNGQHFAEGFDEDFLKSRRAALVDYVTSSCSRLRGALARGLGVRLIQAVQSLASGEVDVGAAMMKHWLKGGDAGLKSLGALIQSGYSTQ